MGESHGSKIHLTYRSSLWGQSGGVESGEGIWISGGMDTIKLGWGRGGFIVNDS